MDLVDEEAPLYGFLKDSVGMAPLSRLCCGCASLNFFFQFLPELDDLLEPDPAPNAARSYLKAPKIWHDFVMTKKNLR